jgi:hypothetical protein
VYAAETPFNRTDDCGCDARHGANGCCRRTGRQRNGRIDAGLSCVWNHPAFPWFEGPITNLSRWPQQRPQTEGGSAALPASKVGISNYDQLVGDYKSPILKPWATEVVKKFGEISLSGVTFPNPSNQCWPFPPPFIYKQFLMQMIQQPDRILMLYNGDQLRRVRLNQPHPSSLTPSWYGDSVGHYEGDTLVIDTVGVKTDRPYAMIDLFGTPYTDKLHIVETLSAARLRRKRCT